MYVFVREKRQKRTPKPKYYQDYIIEDNEFKPEGKGKMLLRQPMWAWDLILCRQSGGTKKQSHLLTITYWDLIDEGLDTIYCRAKTALDNNVVPDQIYSEIYQKIKGMRNKCNDHYSINYKDEKAAREKLWSLGQKGKDRRTDYIEGKYKSQPQQRTIIPGIYSQSEIETIKELLKAGLNHLAKKYHPDTGHGDLAKMTLVNTTCDRLKQEFRI